MVYWDKKIEILKIVVIFIKTYIKNWFLSWTICVCFSLWRYRKI